MKTLFVFNILLFIASEASACPMCTSPRAVQIRNYLFGPELLFNVCALLLPFLIFTAIVIYIYYYDLPFDKNRRV